jgi:hypothetical protein
MVSPYFFICEFANKPSRTRSFQSLKPQSRRKIMVLSFFVIFVA